MSTDQKESPKEASKAPPEDTVIVDRNPTPSSFTAVNGHTSPAKPSNGVPTPAVEVAKPSPTPKERDTPKVTGISVPQTQSGTASLTTSPSIVDSTSTNAARNETPNSPQTAANSPPRKRSYPEEFEHVGRETKRPALPESQEVTKPVEAMNVVREHIQPQEQAPVRKVEQQRQRPLSSEYDPLAQPAQSYYSRQEDSDQQMSDHLRRDSEDPNDSRARYASPDDDEPQRHQFGEYSRTSGVQVDADRKRRKRVFSNRTKTGCMTCRKRKKKCDELHPECNNCLRGGFVCEGYTVRNAWGQNTPKQPAVKTPIALQSKPITYTTPHPHHPSSRYEVNEYGGSAKPEPTRIEEHHREMATRVSPSGEGRSTHPGYPGPPPHPYAHAPPSQHQSPHQRYERPIQSAHENVHEPPEATNPYPVSSAHISAGPSHHPPPSHPQHSHHSSMGRTSSIHGATVLAPAQEPPSSTSLVRRPQSHRAELSERDKMLRGEYYLPYTPALIADREQCAAAVWRFNNSTNPANGIPPEDRMRFFRQILELRPSHDTSVPPPGPHEPPPDPQYVPNGSVGPGVVVEAPFHCDYGYNITIGQDVVIGPDCRISDTCAVTIGNNVVFSPGVKLVCATYAIDPRERRKGKGRALGRNIVIEDDAWIGSNVTVLPGVRVGRCSTVGAGSLLHKDVPPYTVVAGNPPKVVRGIYDDGRN